MDIRSVFVMKMERGLMRSRPVIVSVYGVPKGSHTCKIDYRALYRVQRSAHNYSAPQL